MPDFSTSDFQFYTIKEVANLLRVSEITVRRRIKKGTIPARLYCGHYLIPADYVTKIIDWGENAT